MARPGVLGDVMSGFLRYDTADDFGRKKLIWVFLVAFLQLVLPFCAIFCLFQLWLMARTGSPTIFSACSRKKYVLPVAEGPEKSGTTTPGMAGGTERVKNLPPQGKGIIAPTLPK